MNERNKNKPSIVKIWSCLNQAAGGVREKQTVPIRSIT